MATFPTTGVEFPDGINKDIDSNRYAVKQDNKAFSDGQKSETEWKHEVSDVKIRVWDSEIVAVINFLETNKAELNRFTIPAMTYFNRTTTDNYAYILDYTNPTPVTPRRWELTLNLIWQPTP